MFIYACFIRKDTQELRDKLKEIGINPHPCIAPKCVDYLFVNRGFYSRNEIGYEEETRAAIDCGTNEGLFLAIVALRNDTDKNQWFTDGSDDFWYISGDDNNDSTVKYYKERYNRKIHKATIKELINHFKKE